MNITVGPSAANVFALPSPSLPHGQNDKSGIISPIDRDRPFEKSVLVSQMGLVSAYAYSVFSDGHTETSILGERSQILRDEEEQIINRRHAPRMKGSKFVYDHEGRMVSQHQPTTNGRASPSLSTLSHEPSHTHTYTYHTLISHTRAGIEAEEERLRLRAREEAEEERERALRGKKINCEDQLYDKSQVINTSAYGYKTDGRSTGYTGRQSILYSYAAVYDHGRADSPLVGEHGLRDDDDMFENSLELADPSVLGHHAHHGVEMSRTPRQHTLHRASMTGTPQPAYVKQFDDSDQLEESNTHLATMSPHHRSIIQQQHQTPPQQILSIE